MSLTDGLTEPVTCSTCGAVSVNGGTLHCHGCYTVATNQRRILEDRVAILREGILEARREGCACDFHLYGEDQGLESDETLDAYCTMQQTLNREMARVEELEAAIREHAEVVRDTLHAGEDIDRRLWSVLDPKH